ncbi:thiamine pyrophosphate-binding protein [candidate division KSB1 bacterium]
MRSLITGYLDHTVSRRGFMKNMLASGFTLSSAESVIKSLEGVKEKNILHEGDYRTMTGSGGELLVQQIKDAGVKYVFTNTGSFEVGFFDALVKEPDIQLILGLHEGVVISMADGYHRVSREPAFVNVHVIAGTAQMAGQLYNAHKDNSSLMVTAGLLDNEIFSDDTFLAPSAGFDQKEINRQFTKISWEVKNAESIPVMTRRGFKVAMTQPGGPVYLAYANYALEAKNVKGDIVPRENFMIPSRIKGAPDLIEKMAEKLIEAKNPVIIFGDEVWKAGAQDKAVECAELLSLPTASVREAFRNFPTQHPLYIGSYSPGRTFLDNNVDLVVTFGSKDFGGNTVTSVENSTELIRCGINTSNIGRNYPFDLAVVGSVDEILTDLIDCIKGICTAERIKTIKDSRYSGIAAYTKASRARLLDRAKANFNASPVHPDRLGYDMSRTLDSNAIIVSENFGGSYDFFNFGLRDNETMWMFNTGFSLGWGVGTAMGAKLAEPNRQVVLSIGDGSVMYSASGFWTQVRYGIPIINIVWNNKNYQTVRSSFHRYNGAMADTGHYAGIYLGEPDIDFVKLAESQGMEGETVTSPGEIEPALKRGIQKTRDGKPYLIDVAVARTGNGAESEWYQKFNLAALRTRKV